MPVLHPFKKVRIFFIPLEPIFTPWGNNTNFNFPLKKHGFLDSRIAFLKLDSKNVSWGV